MVAFLPGCAEVNSSGWGFGMALALEAQLIRTLQASG
jgi:hypothetical protein